jgi:hypothetical protein
VYHRVTKATTYQAKVGFKVGHSHFPGHKPNHRKADKSTDGVRKRSWELGAHCVFCVMRVPAWPSWTAMTPIGTPCMASVVPWVWRTNTLLYQKSGHRHCINRKSSNRPC